MDARDIILRPVVIEKSMNLMDDKKYTFGVFISATKTQVHNAAEETFDVKVKNVNIMNVRGEEKRAGHYTGRTAHCRKVIITLAGDSDNTKIFNDNKGN